MPAAVLLAEPEPIARTFLERHLIENGFAVLSKPEEGRPHLVLAGDLEAVDVWSGEVPVIVLGREEADVVERVRAFEMGATTTDKRLVQARLRPSGAKLGHLAARPRVCFATFSSGGRPSGGGTRVGSHGDESVPMQDAVWMGERREGTAELAPGE